MKKIIKGHYKIESDFTTICSDNTIYTITCNGAWGSLSVGESNHMGLELTQKAYDKIKGECTNFGTFTLD